MKFQPKRTIFLFPAGAIITIYLSLAGPLPQWSRTLSHPGSEQNYQRIAPPKDLDCPHNQATVFAGEVVKFERRKNQLSVTIKTDWATTETRSLNFLDEEALLKIFRLDGKPFRREHWQRIETDDRSLRAGVRANVWVCGEADRQVVKLIDWESPNQYRER